MPNPKNSQHPSAICRASEALESWRRLPGVCGTLACEAAEAAYGSDTGGARRRLAGAVIVDDADALPEIVKVAARLRVALYPISTGRNWGYGSALPAADDCVVVDLSRLRRILDFDGELGTVTVEPGVTQQMLAEFLDEGHHAFMVPVTGAGPDASLLGNALERGYGITPISDHFAAVTDIQAVLADGTIYRTALAEAGCHELARLSRWGLGPYLTGLFSQGALGIVTRMTLQLARRPACIQAGLFGLAADGDLEDAVAKIQHLLASLPGIIGGVNLMNQHRVLAMVAPYPASSLDEHGLIPPATIESMGRAHSVLPWTGFMTLYGTPSVVRAARREIARRLRGTARRLLFVSPRTASWLLRASSTLPAPWGPRLHATASTLNSALGLVQGRPNRTAIPLAFWRSGAAPQELRVDPARDGAGLLWYAPLVPMAPASVRTAIEHIHATTRRHGIEPLITLTSVGDRLFDSTVPILFDRASEAQRLAAQACYAELVEEGRGHGIFPYRLGIDGMSAYRQHCREASQIAHRLLAATDPARILSPGRYVGP